MPCGFQRHTLNAREYDGHNHNRGVEPCDCVEQPRRLSVDFLYDSEKKESNGGSEEEQAEVIFNLSENGPFDALRGLCRGQILDMSSEAVLAGFGHAAASKNCKRLRSLDRSERAI